MDKHQGIPKGQSKMNNPEKLTTQGTQDKEKHKTICVGNYYMQTNTNNVNTKRALLQTTGGKDEANIVFMRKSQHGTQKIRVITKLPNSEQSYKGKVKTHNFINRQNQSTTGKL